METVNCISNQKLTEIENEVYNLCVANAETYGEDGGFCYDVLKTEHTHPIRTV